MLGKAPVRNNRWFAFIAVVISTSLLISGISSVVFAAEDPGVFLTNRVDGKILKPYLSFMSLKPLTVSLDDPRGIACGPGGLLYVAETSKGRIVRFNQQGNYKEEVVVDEPGSGFSGHPLNLDFGPNGNLFFTTPKSGLWMIEAGDPRKEPEKLLKGKYFNQQGHSLHDLAFLKTGEYAGDIILSVFTEKPYGGYVVRIPAPDYNQIRPFIEEYSVEELGNKVSQHLRVPVALAVNDLGEIFIADHEKREYHVLRYSPGGEFVDIFVESITNPMDLNFSAEGKLYATLGPLWREDQEGGGVKIYSRSGDQELYVPRSNIWGVALCEN